MSGDRVNAIQIDTKRALATIAAERTASTLTGVSQRRRSLWAPSAPDMGDAPAGRPFAIQHAVRTAASLS